MSAPCQWKDKVLSVGPAGFEAVALEIFRFQYEQNDLYRQYADAVHKTPASVHTLGDIPFLPIRFFKSHVIAATSFQPELIFESSGTTGVSSSRHYVKDGGLYKDSLTSGFELFYGSAKEWCILGLLPSYLERNNSSLVYMVNELIRQSGHASSGFYLNEFDELYQLLEKLELAKQKTLLIGVTFALLDFAAWYASRGGRPLKWVTVMETGGMKGRRKEMIRQEVQDELKAALGLPVIHSEYGMTELLSQAYSKGEGIFQTPPWMKIVLRDDEDPFQLMTSPYSEKPITGAINVIDLANVYSCSFIATDDAGRLYSDGSFEVLGRLDNSDLRGCSLLTL